MDKYKNYLNNDGQLKGWPAKKKQQMSALFYLSEKFEWGKHYTEDEVNQILASSSLIDDAALLRRELCENNFLAREKDGSNYWKLGNQMPIVWETDKLIINDATEEDIERLEQIYKNCSYIGEWTGKEEDDANPMLSEFNHKHLPPNGIKELHRLQSIRLKTDNEIIGYLILYHGYPDQSTLWVAVMAIHTDYQGKELGQDVVEYLSKEAKKLKIYDNLGLTVGLKNWPALRFWINTGFDKIIKFNGDKEFGGDKFADLWLKKEL